MKRTICAMLIMIILIQIAMPIMSVAAEEITASSDSRFKYTVKEDGTASISKYVGTDTQLVIPSSLDGIKVTKIGDWAFSGCSNLSGIEIPEGVTSIGSRAFAGCSSLSSIEIPNSVTWIGNYAFSGCSSLENIFVEKDNLQYSSKDGILFDKDKTKIIKYPEKKSQTEYIIPNSVTSIGAWAFYGCSSLSSIEIPSSVTSIGEDAFSSCSSLSSIEIQEGVTSIDDSAFYGCSSLSSIEIPEGVTRIGDSAFSRCSSLSSIEIPSSVTSIGEYAFSSCSSLSSIEIPEGVTSIDDYAFSGCSSLENIFVEKDNLKFSSKDGILFDKDKTEIIKYPEKKSQTEYIIPNSVTSIGNYAFDGCSSLSSIEIPDGVTSISSGAFWGCSSLSSIEIPDGVTSIGSDAFDGCSSLSSIEIPSSVTSIGKYAFDGCSSLSSIEIPDGVTSIGENTFHSCSSLSSIEIPNSVTSIGNYAFYRCSSLSSIEIPSSVTNIGGYAFSECSSLSSIEIPEGVTSIDYRTFYGCSRLSSIEISKSVTSIGDYAFSWCGRLSSIEITEGVTSIGNYAFSVCSSLSSVVIPNSVISIGESAFDRCNNLTIKCKSNTVAEEYAKENNKNYIIDDEIECEIQYSTEELTNKNVVVTLILNEKVREIEGWNVLEDQLGITKTYEQNVNEDIQVIDLVGNTLNVNINISNIDKTKPITSVNYNITTQTNKDVIATITSNEPIQEVAGWSLSEDKKVLTKTYSANGSESVTIKDIAGNEVQEQVNVGNIDKVKPEATVKYSKESITNENVVVTIGVNEQVQQVAGWNLSEDKKVLTKTYSANGSESVTIKDIAGNEIQVQVNVGNIDKVKPEATVKYSKETITNENVVVTIEVNEQIQEVTGWSLSEDKKVLTKTYSANASENVTIKDIAGNEVQVQVNVKNIDKVPPQILGVTEGRTYSKVVLQITDENLTKVILTKNGQEVTYENGQEIKEEGNYTITAEDKAGNKTCITFIIKEEIKIKDYIIKDNYVTDVKAGTTVEQIKDRIESNTSYEIQTKTGQKVVAGELIKTGMKIVYEENVYTIVVKGDTNGDGKVSITDLTKIKKHIIGQQRLEKEYEQAGDLNESDNITVTDLARMKKAIVGLISL